jgi:hypothetical protein
VPEMKLNAAEAAELAEMLQFVSIAASLWSSI